jgi:hypothetical protein
MALPVGLKPSELQTGLIKVQERQRGRERDWEIERGMKKEKEREGFDIL